MSVGRVIAGTPCSGVQDFKGLWLFWGFLTLAWLKKTEKIWTSEIVEVKGQSSMDTCVSIDTQVYFFSSNDRQSRYNFLL